MKTNQIQIHRELPGRDGIYIRYRRRSGIALEYKIANFPGVVEDTDPDLVAYVGPFPSVEEAIEWNSDDNISQFMQEE